MLTLALRTVRHQLAAVIAVACAVLGGAALVTLAGVLVQSGTDTHPPVGRLAGADVVVAANQSLTVVEDLDVGLPERRTVPADLVARLSQLPGVTAAAGDVSFPAALVDAGGRVSTVQDATTAGHGWSSSVLLSDRSMTGTAPAARDEVALGAALATSAAVVVGNRVQLVTAGETAEYRVSAILAAADAGVLVPDATAARFAGRLNGPQAGSVDLVGLRVAPGAQEQVAAAARDLLAGEDLLVETGPDRGDLLLPAAGTARSALVVLGTSLIGVPLIVVGFIVVAAASGSVAGQRRDLSLLRAVGGTPRQVRSLVAAQTSLVAALAAVPGVAAGYALSHSFERFLGAIGVLPAGVQLGSGPLPGLSAAVLFVLVAQVSARVAARRVSREPVTVVLREAPTGNPSPSPRRTAAGLLLVAGAAPLSVLPLLARTPIGAAGTATAGIVAAIGLALAGPALLTWVSRGLASRLPARVGAPGWLAVANLRGHVLRSASAVTTLAMAVLFVLTYGYAQTTLVTAVTSETTAGTLADATLTADRLGGIPEGLLERVRATPGVLTAAPVKVTTVVWPVRTLGDELPEAMPAIALTPAAAGVIDLDVRAGSLDQLTGDTVALGVDLARSAGTQVGDTVDFVLGDGTPTQARVVAIYARSLGFGSVAASIDLTAGHLSSGLADSILIRSDGTEQTQEQLTALVADVPGLDLTGATSGGASPGTPPEVWLNLVIIAALMSYVLIGIANSLFASTLQRREELNALRRIGATTRQVRSAMRQEAALVAAGAVIAGTGLAAVPLMLLGIGFLGRPLPGGPGWLMPATIAVVTLVAVLAVEVATRVALRDGDGVSSATRSTSALLNSSSSALLNSRRST